MVPGLRKRHLSMWIVLAVLLPAGWAWAYFSILPPVHQRLDRLTPTGQAVSEAPFYEDEAFRLWLAPSAEDSGRWLLQVAPLQALHRPSALLYLAEEDDSEGILLGKLGPQPFYRFLLPPGGERLSGKRLRWFDGIKQESFHQITVP